PPRRTHTYALPLHAALPISRTEAARGAAQEHLRSREVAELRHRDAAQRERRRIVAKRNPFERADRIARRERTRRGGDQRVHPNRSEEHTSELQSPTNLLCRL